MKTDPVWSTKVSQIWLWDDYPQRWGKDCGIDLVYEDNQGKHWAIQSKCISPDREITKAEIDSFLSESSDSRIHGRLLIASTDGIGKNAQNVLIGRRSRSSVSSWNTSGNQRSISLHRQKTFQRGRGRRNALLDSISRKQSTTS